ncbi:MAG: DUF3365 domain-containing protein [Thermodesulfobacteriota bacterium]
MLKEIIRDLADKDQHNLRLRFQVGLGIILFCFCLFTATIIYHFQKNLLEEETARQTHLVMTILESTRGYIREVLRPKMYEEMGEDHFTIEAMSTSFITRVIMDRFTETLPAFKYRRVAIDARNPAFEASDSERKIIDYFQRNPDQPDQRGVTRSEYGLSYTLYRPVIFRPSCLHCHGNPDLAPSAITKTYGVKRGFHRQGNEIAGLLSISIPLDAGLAQIRDTSLRMFGTAVILALLLYGAIWLLFHQLIVTNLRDILTLFRTTLDTTTVESRPEKLKGHREELEEVFRSARTIVSDLNDSRSQLEEYTDNLETKVTERTEALERSQDMLQDQVKKRNRELLLYNTLTGLITSKEGLQTIFLQAIQEVLQVIPAKGAGIYLYDDQEACFHLQCTEQAATLPQTIKPTPAGTNIETDPAQQYIADCSHIRIIPVKDRDDLSISIPLCCRNQLLGIMVINELDHRVVNESLRDLLLSIGQQIGITIESLQNIRNLRHSTELLQSVFDGISDPLILLGPDGILQMVNQAFLLRHGLERNDVMGRPIDEIDSRSQCMFDHHLQGHDLTERSPHTKEVQLKDGSIYDTYFYPILNRDQSIRAIICFGKDVTTIKETEHRIRQTEKLVAIGQLAAGVAHEINNPLGVILCHTDLIKEDNADDEELVHDIMVIERHTENCRRIVADLLDFSRSRGTTMDRKVQPINTIVDNVLAMTQRQCSSKRISVDKDLPAEDLYCLVDSGRIKQVLLNLIMNSVQAVEEKGEIRVAIKIENSQAAIEIEDNGPGISNDIIDKIFDPFFTTKEPGRGTGLGLSISYGIIQEHDGEIKVESKPGENTRFTITLPLSQPTGENA